jgi:hypothetical protein
MGFAFFTLYNINMLFLSEWEAKLTQIIRRVFNLNRPSSDEKQRRHIRFEVFTAVTMKNDVFSMWRRVCLVRTDVYEETCRFHLQCRKNSRAKKSVGRLLTGAFLCNVGSYKTHKAPHPRRRVAITRL